MKFEKNRLRTFENWNVPFISKHELALFGFYSMKQSDFVKCFFCNVEIGMWEEGDCVLNDHVRWSPNCDLIRKRKNGNIPLDPDILNYWLSTIPADPDTIITKTIPENVISSTDIHISDVQGTIEDLSRICLICMNQQRDVVFIPCGHIFSCYECSCKLKNKSCPVCRKTVIHINKIFYS